MSPTAQIVTRLSDYKPFPFDISHVRLDFLLDSDRTIVRSQLLIHRKPLIDLENLGLKLDGENLDLLEIRVDGVTLPSGAYFVDGTGLIIRHVPDTFKLELEVSFNPAANTELSGLYMSGGRYCTQCEAEGFRRIMFWPDRPDVMSRFRVRIEAPKPAHPILLSNGNLIASGDIGDDRHWAEWEDPHPKPSYLFALVAGDFDVLHDQITTMNGKDVALAIYVEQGESSRALYAMDALKRSMKWDEEIFGREYDLEVFNIVAVADFNGGAMENKGLNIFNSALLMADEETATDVDYEAIETVVAHEYFHNWSGNRVTCRDWFQLSLKEGFTVFRDQEFSADQRSRSVKRIKDVKSLRARQFPEDSGPLAHPVRPSSYIKIENFYTATVYEKGAEVIRVMQSLMGASAFYKGSQLYFDHNDGTAATIEDWLIAMRAASDNPLAGIERWYEQAGTPVLSVSSTYDASAETLTLELNQSTPDTVGQSDKTWVPLPVRMAFFGSDGRQLRLRVGSTQVQADDWLVPMTSDKLTLVFEDAKTRPVVSVLRGFSAPVQLQQTISDTDLALLAACDTDTFVRWESSQTLARKLILKVADSSLTGDDVEMGDELAKSLAIALNEAKFDPAFAALMLRMPDVGELMLLRNDCDPEALHVAHIIVKRTLAGQLEGPLADTFAIYDPAQAFSTNAEAAGRRALAAATLDLMAASGSDREALRCENFFFASRNMTDMMAALSSLSQIGGLRFEAVLSAFQERFSSNALVIDKWFRVQVMATSGDGIATFNRLRRDPTFNILNPNRVRALGAAFAMGNYHSFHRRDGAGYQVLCDLIGDVDNVNNVVAARLCTLLQSTSRVEFGRRQNAKQAITGLLDRNNLSDNSREILSKISSAV